mgnify:CR=1 FL=1
MPLCYDGIMQDDSIQCVTVLKIAVPSRFFINCLLSIPWEPEIIFHVESQYETRAPKGCYYILVKLSPIYSMMRLNLSIESTVLLCLCLTIDFFPCEATIGKQLAANSFFIRESYNIFTLERIFRRSFCKQFFQCQHFERKGAE